MVLITAHHRKMAGDYGDQIAGSIQAQATVDGILELRRDPSLLPHQRRLSLTGRDWEDVKDEVLTLDPQSLTFQVVGSYEHVSGEVTKERKAPDIQVLREGLPEGSPGITYKELEEKTGWDRRVISKLVKMMGDEVGREGKPQSKKNPLRLFRRVSESTDGLEDQGPGTENLVSRIRSPSYSLLGLACCAAHI